MKKDKKAVDAENEEKRQHAEAKKKMDQELDDEIEQSFPASDPPSYSQPHHHKKS
ncbi:hypothetical protein QT327_19335 [Olivibacter sp. 47]|uniref:hypothetical protein n=1 Tax=Olivibacter sp. 47 TaxID=3056486 RepID=UPI0025A3C640|nr:hypothetical protein [Olivibacter sp. 47]MDM8176471.1 hypothetical protein [Olivibacter sp. 47]